MKAPMPVPGWDVPRDYYAPDEDDAPMTEELLAELAAMRRLIEKLHHDIARLIHQQQRTEQAAEPRPRDDDEESD